MSSGGLNMQSKRGFNPFEIQEISPCGRFYCYKQFLGRGAFKDVYRGFDQVSKTEIAWCQICVDDDNWVQENLDKLCSEAVLMMSLEHKNIMKCFSYWVDEQTKTVNLITEFFSSGSLRQYLKKQGSNIDLPVIKNWARQILEGLYFLHSHNPKIIHRDIKCDNVFVNAAGDVKIGDFGLASAMDKDISTTVVGTPEFMAPEYYDELYNELVDVYAFGMCMLEMATGEKPYSECSNPAQIFRKVTSGVKPRALEKVNDLEVKEIIERCLAPASVRPSALALLQDPFFLPDVRMEESSETTWDFELWPLDLWPETTSTSKPECSKDCVVGSLGMCCLDVAFRIGEPLDSSILSQKEQELWQRYCCRYQLGCEMPDLNRMQFPLDF